MTTATPGWYPDPSGNGGQRWWDGQTWTEHSAAAAATPYTTETLKAPEGAKTNTPYIWLIIALPLLTFVPLFFVDWGAMVRGAGTDPYASTAATMGIFFSPGYVLTMVLSWGVYGLSVFFAYRDVKALEAAGVPRPFHWAFAFISSYVYPIGRSVVVKRRTGRDGGTLLASILAIVLLFVLAIVFVVVVTAQVFAAMTPYLYSN